ncbi:hypothetical protein JP75_00140 [Devosia riboflavina]|uniref:Uncharacterized protein n=1 Tax=Devosia riboflavina TaxID=46914 RepID=A0A087M6W2_9HYPH|nr:hypothetical protein [Devosia riboflavina]KFL32615.1 hypothetical protein JP75_00140 [Devosia riboflavina]
MTDPMDIEQNCVSQKTEIVREVRIRLPDVIVLDLKLQAHMEGTTMNALIAGYIDEGLKKAGRPGVFSRATRFSDYLRRKGGYNSAAANRAQDDGNFT